MHTILQDQLNFRQNDKKIKQKVSNQNLFLVTKAVLGQFNHSQSGISEGDKKKSITGTSTTSRSQGKQGRLLLRDYLYLMNKNAEKVEKQAKSLEKNEIRKKKYQLDEERVFYLMQDEMKSQLNEVIERLQKIKECFKDKSLKNQEKTNTQNIDMIYNIRNIIKQKFKKGIQEINMILFEQERRVEQMFKPTTPLEPEGLKSENCFNKKPGARRKQAKISLQLTKSPISRENLIAINGSKFMADFV